MTMNRKTFMAGVKTLASAVNSNLAGDLAFYAVQQALQHGNKTELADLLLALTTDKGRYLSPTGTLLVKYIEFNVQGFSIHKAKPKAGTATKARQAAVIRLLHPATAGNHKAMAGNICVKDGFAIRDGKLNAAGNGFAVSWQQFALVEKEKAKPAGEAKPASAKSLLARINGIAESLQNGLICSREELAELSAALISLTAAAEKAGNRYLQNVQSSAQPAAPAAETPATPAVDPAPAAKVPTGKALTGSAAVKRERKARESLAKRDAALAAKRVAPSADQQHDGQAVA